jgi:glycerol 2-dehydrogenase (NADP+)
LGIQKGTSVLPRSSKPGQIKSNIDLGNWELHEDEMGKLDAVKDRFKACSDGYLPECIFFDDDE